jgi:hypothetical protein
MAEPTVVTELYFKDECLYSATYSEDWVGRREVTIKAGDTKWPLHKGRRLAEHITVDNDYDALALEMGRKILAHLSKGQEEEILKKAYLKDGG